MSDCTKVTYATRGEALVGARHFLHTLRRNQKRKNKAAILEPYRCDKCGWYHLTSREKKR